MTDGGAKRSISLQVQLAPRADAERPPGSAGRARNGGEPAGSARPVGPLARRLQRQRAGQHAVAGRQRQAALAHQARLVDAVLLVDGAKQVRRRSSTDSETPRKSRPLRPQREVEDLEHALLRLADRGR